MSTNGTQVADRATAARGNEDTMTAYYLPGIPAILHTDDEGPRWNGFRSPRPTGAELGAYMANVLACDIEPHIAVSVIAELSVSYLGDTVDNTADVLADDETRYSHAGLTWEILPDGYSLTSNGYVEQD